MVHMYIFVPNKVRIGYIKVAQLAGYSKCNYFDVELQRE